MLENTPNQHDTNPGEYNPLLWALQRPIQHQLARQGIYVSPDEASKLLEQKIVHNAKRYLQQDLAEHGIDVSPDEALAIHSLRTIHRMMVYTDTADPHEAIERMAFDNPSEPYEPHD